MGDVPDRAVGVQQDPALALTRHPPRNRPLAKCGPERLLAIPVHPVLVTLLAVAHQAAAHKVFAHRKPAVNLGHNVVERRAATKRIATVCAAVVPGEMDLIARRSACDQARLINVVTVQGPTAGGLRSPRFR